MFWLDDEELQRNFSSSTSSPRFAKTHVPAQLMPKSAFDEKCKMILALRDPKDVVVSYFHFYAKHPDDFAQFPGSFSEFLSMFIDGYIHWGDWTNHTNGWWQYSKQQNILPVFYEDNKHKPQQVIQQIANYIGKPVSSQEAALIAQVTSFEKVKERKTSSFAEMFYRKGETGDWRNYFSEEEKKKFDEWLNENIQDQELRKRFLDVDLRE